jgi:hypothetical protein
MTIRKWKQDTFLTVWQGLCAAAMMGEIGTRAGLTAVRALKALTRETAHMLAAHRREGVGMADAETVAESVAFVFLDHYGIDTSGYSAPDIVGWARDPAVVGRNLDTVRTPSHVLLTACGGACPPLEEGGRGSMVMSERFRFVPPEEWPSGETSIKGREARDTDGYDGRYATTCQSKIDLSWTDSTHWTAMMLHGYCQ